MSTVEIQKVNLENIKIFFDWFDAAYSNSSSIQGSPSAIKTLWEWRRKIPICTTTGYEGNEPEPKK